MKITVSAVIFFMDELKFEGEDGVKKLTQEEKKYMQKYVEDIYQQKRARLKRQVDLDWEAYWNSIKKQEGQKIIQENGLGKLVDDYNKVLKEFQELEDKYNSEVIKGIDIPSEISKRKYAPEDFVRIDEKIHTVYDYSKKTDVEKLDYNVYGRAKKTFMEDNPVQKRLNTLQHEYQMFVESIIFAGKKSVYEALQNLKAL
jgi:hypothetical protein